MKGMARSRSYEEYKPLRRGRRCRRSWLRTAQLNVVGWSALLGLCLVAAVAGVAVIAALGLPGPFGMACAVVPLVLVVVVDRRRWARMGSGFGWGGPVEEVTRIAMELQARGARAHVITSDIADGWGESANRRMTGSAEKSAWLEYQNRDADVVAAVLREHGIQPPELL
jgi:hypothetical protein